MRDDDDYDDYDAGDFGNADGDTSGRGVAFQAANPGMPWLRAGQPPWHLWGNTQQVSTIVQSTITPATRTSTSQQLVKVSYKRPETWHWAFAAKLLSGPPSAGVGSIQLSVYFDLIVGIGRSSIRFVASPTAAGINANGFEAYFFQWGPVGAFPQNAQLYSTQVLGPNRTFTTDPPFPNQGGFPVPGAFVTGPSLINEIVAQDIQLGVQLIALATDPADPAIGQRVVCEVSAQFAPKVHMRPDWYLQAPDEAVFAGGETGGS